MDKIGAMVVDTVLVFAAATAKTSDVASDLDKLAPVCEDERNAHGHKTQRARSV